MHTRLQRDRHQLAGSNSGSQIHLFQHLYLTRSPFVLYVHSTRLGLRAQGVIPTTEHRGILQWQMDTTASQRMDTTLLTYAVSLQ